MSNIIKIIRLNIIFSPVNYDQENKPFLSKSSYTTFGTNINFLINNKILEIPDYIKIDVDGIEHLILDGANKYLSNKKIKSILIETNEEFILQNESIKNLLLDAGFELHKKFRQSESMYNLIFNKKWVGQIDEYFFSNNK